ncbi:ABC-three component system protein [Streptomyces sp. NPDC059070]|uniref:ABC-three component system protein n=1 Tax=Streptomyces sp. NPDC059070 TaxID=3346713 RepID=UPI003681F225
MLRRLSSSDARFKTLEFHSGLNILLAEARDQSSFTDSRNGAGKTSFIELLHFLLGGKADKSVAVRPELRDASFSLKLDWPSLADGITVTRSGARAATIRLSPSPRESSRLELISTDATVSLAEWQRIIEEDLFRLPDDRPGVSGRSLLSYFMRRSTAHAFNEAIRIFPRQSDSEATTNLAYLLDLDWKLANQYRAISKKEASRKQLIKAAEDPMLGRIVGKSAELRGQITITEARVAELRAHIGEFRVVPEYENLKKEANAIASRMRSLNSQDSLDRSNLSQLEEAVADADNPQDSYLENLYEELGVVIQDAAIRRFDEVRQFHASVIQNRRRYLLEEITSLKKSMESRSTLLAELGTRHSTILQHLNAGGALDGLIALQQSLAREEAALESLRQRYEAATALESSRREITAMRVKLEQDMDLDLQERRSAVEQAVLLFSEYAQRLYGDGRPAYLAIEAGANSLKITPHIESDNSRGIGNMSIFCFDMMLATTVRRRGLPLDFLVHDSHLFDGVDGRQLASALELGAAIAEREGFQYIVTMNSDELEKAQNNGFDVGRSLLGPTLTDALDDGGIFGFRFT